MLRRAAGATGRVTQRYAGGSPTLSISGSPTTWYSNIVLIESEAAVDALDEMLTVPGLDVVAVARGDLSVSLGVPGQFDDPRLREIVAEAEGKILACDSVALGGIAFSADEPRAMIAAGYRFIVLGSDTGLISSAARGMVQAIHSERQTKSRRKS